MKNCTHTCPQSEEKAAPLNQPLKPQQLEQTPENLALELEKQNFEPFNKLIVNGKRKRGDVSTNGLRFWEYKRGKEVWMREDDFIKRRAKLALWLKTKRENDHAWRERNDKRTSERRKNPEIAAYRLKRKRELYAESEERRARILLQAKQSRERLTPFQKRQRLNKHLEYCRKRYATDALFNLSVRVRRRIKVFLKGRGIDIRTSTRKMVGCDTETLKRHLESLFCEGMGWHNKNKWHIDHIIPLASAKSEDEILRLCHYTNLQPLWAIDNLRKGNKIIWQYQ